MTILVNLREGFARLHDDSGEPCVEWRDRVYADAIQRGECTKRRWADMITELAIASNYVNKVDGSWKVTNQTQWTHKLPEHWRKV